MENGAPSEPRTVLEAWSLRAKRAAFGHYEAARHLDRRHRTIGLLLLTCSAISACLAGRTWFGLPNPIVDGTMTIFSALTLAISCIHVFLQDEHRAERHRRSGVRYAALKREIEQVLSGYDTTQPSSDVITDIRVRIDTLSEDAPPIAVGILSTAKFRSETEKHSLPPPPKNLPSG